MTSKNLRDNVPRNKRPSPLGKAIFIGLRTADVFWQYNLITRGWGLQLIQKFGGQAVNYNQVWNHSAGHLHPYYGLICALSLGSTLKQAATMIFITEQEIPPSAAVMVSIFNTIFNSANTLFSLWAVTSPAPTSSNFMDIIPKPILAIGFGAYVVGLLTEAISEFQRKAFKEDPANKGKPYGGGLFSLATNINYGGYTVWRAGYALASGGAPWGILTFAFFFHDFVTRGVPVMDEYLVGRYGNAYKEIKTRVKYSLIPGIY